jgi:hypothetical protein
MRSAVVAAIVLVAAAAAASCHGPLRPAAPPYTVTGRIDTLEAGTLSLDHKTGQRMRIMLSGETVVTNEGHPASPADIAAGMRVVVVYHFADAVAVADEVRLFRGPINYP